MPGVAAVEAIGPGSWRVSTSTDTAVTVRLSVAAAGAAPVASSVDPQTGDVTVTVAADAPVRTLAQAVAAEVAAALPATTGTLDLLTNPAGDATPADARLSARDLGRVAELQVLRARADSLNPAVARQARRELVDLMRDMGVLPEPASGTAADAAPAPWATRYAALPDAAQAVVEEVVQWSEAGLLPSAVPGAGTFLVWKGGLAGAVPAGITFATAGLVLHVADDPAKLGAAVVAAAGGVAAALVNPLSDRALKVAEERGNARAERGAVLPADVRRVLDLHPDPAARDQQAADRRAARSGRLRGLARSLRGQTAPAAAVMDAARPRGPDVDGGPAPRDTDRTPHWRSGLARPGVWATKALAGPVAGLTVGLGAAQVWIDTGHQLAVSGLWGLGGAVLASAWSTIGDRVLAGIKADLKQARSTVADTRLRAQAEAAAEQRAARARRRSDAAPVAGPAARLLSRLLSGAPTTEQPAQGPAEVGVRPAEAGIRPDGRRWTAPNRVEAAALDAVAAAFTDRQVQPGDRPGTLVVQDGPGALPVEVRAVSPRLLGADVVARSSLDAGRLTVEVSARATDRAAARSARFLAEQFRAGQDGASRAGDVLRDRSTEGPITPDLLTAADRARAADLGRLLDDLDAATGRQRRAVQAEYDAAIAAAGLAAPSDGDADRALDWARRREAVGEALRARMAARDTLPSTVPGLQPTLVRWAGASGVPVGVAAVLMTSTGGLAVGAAGLGVSVAAAAAVSTLSAVADRALSRAAELRQDQDKARKTTPSAARTAVDESLDAARGPATPPAGDGPPRRRARLTARTRPAAVPRVDPSPPPPAPSELAIVDTSAGTPRGHGWALREQLTGPATAPTVSQVGLRFVGPAAAGTATAGAAAAVAGGRLVPGLPALPAAAQPGVLSSLTSSSGALLAALPTAIADVAVRWTTARAESARSTAKSALQREMAAALAGRRAAGIRPDGTRPVPTRRDRPSRLVRQLGRPAALSGAEPPSAPTAAQLGARWAAVSNTAGWERWPDTDGPLVEVRDGRLEATAVVDLPVAAGTGALLARLVLRVGAPPVVLLTDLGGPGGPARAGALVDVRRALVAQLAATPTEHGSHLIGALQQPGSLWFLQQPPFDGPAGQGHTLALVPDAGEDRSFTAGRWLRPDEVGDMATALGLRPVDDELARQRSRAAAGAAS